MKGAFNPFHASMVVAMLAALLGGLYGAVVGYFMRASGEQTRMTEATRDDGQKERSA